jgi:hypothetical protein
VSVGIFQYILGFLIGTNIYIAFIATVISFTGFLLFHAVHFWAVTGFVFFATQTAYNLQRYFKWQNNHLHEFLKPIVPKNKQAWYILIGISTTGMGATALFLNLEQFILLGILSIPTGLYVFAHPTKKNLTGLRYIPFLKTFLVAFCWTGMFFALAHSAHHIALLKMTWTYWLIVFLQVWQACILFDLRDLETDKGHLKTFANSLSQDGMFVFWTAFFLAITGLSAYCGNVLFIMPIFMAVATIHMICIFKKVSGLNFTFLVDGSLVLYAIGNWVLFTR